MTLRVSHLETITTTNIVTTSNSTPVNVSRAKLLSLQSVIDVNTPSAKTFVAGTSAIDTVTLPAFAGATDGDYFVITDGSGLAWAAALDKTGLASNTPTGAAWVAVPAGRKVYVDVSLQVTATNMCDTVRTALNALTGFTAAVTLSGTATIVATMVVRNPVTAPGVHNKNDSGAGSITATNGTTGIASKVSVSGDSVTITAHGLTTGLKGQASSGGTLPAGITTSTDYFIIVLDANTIQFASSLALALAGTALDLTDQGTNAATHTFTPTAVAGATLTLQKSNDYSPVTGSGTWDAVEAATSITVDADAWISDIDPEYLWARVSFTLTAGRLSASTTVVVKEDI